MSLKSILRGTAVASLLFAVPVLAQTAPTPQSAPKQAGQCERGPGAGTGATSSAAWSTGWTSRWRRAA